VWIAGLDRHKDPFTAITAAGGVARRGTPFVLLLAGDGPLRAEVERAAEADGDGAVRVLGHRRDTRALLAAADLFVLTSRREGLSFSLLEAMALGRAPVVSDAPGNPEAVGDAGVVVACGDIAGFAAGLEQLATDEPARLELGERARDRVRRHFPADEMLRRTKELYDAVVVERASRRRPRGEGAGSPRG
jgi:glycosyltransferase involved in cell wall biosynthesis